MLVVSNSCSWHLQAQRSTSPRAQSQSYSMNQGGKPSPE
ncbi:hypothetical protein GMORB2_0567 [Geosmithia morbida]|uniref:Uncharacterized protein n=1 Tax=Geosmithia morbida TaxID=1094350 RepID=A0A9P5D8I7_9HYPO|nr:uncharacterized protein GMORB2_0567 [Geosmithia morbida]KAF4126830.1 hypothetical protein GMORB2_0567 [Geosmithia morbida]